MPNHLKLKYDIFFWGIVVLGLVSCSYTFTEENDSKKTFYKICSIVFILWYLLTVVLMTIALVKIYSYLKSVGLGNRISLINIIIYATAFLLWTSVNSVFEVILLISKEKLK